MNNIKSLRNFGTIYLWIFAIKVFQVCGDVGHRTDADTERAAVISALLMKPYAYQIFDDDYMDDLLNERNAVATPLWRPLNKQQQQQQQHQLYSNKHLPLITTKNNEKSGNSMASREITFENLNDFNSYKIKNTIWPKVHNQQEQQMHHVKVNNNDANDINQRRHSLHGFFVLQSSLGDGADDEKQRTSMTNIRYRQNGFLPIPIIMEKHFKTQATGATKKSKTPFNDATNEGVSEGDDVKETLFPSKDDNTLNANEVDDDAGSGAVAVAGAPYENEERNGGVTVFADEENGIANSNGNGNESLNYPDNNDANTNYMMAHGSGNDRDRDSHDKHLRVYTRPNLNSYMNRIISKPHDKRAKPSVGHTPFLPAVSGGAMTNLGKFFRDLSKNVHVSEQFQWNAEEQKLLEGDPHFSNLHHHLTKPDAATDQQTAEWIKAIRFYRPSQKIRSLVAMNPHGQWAHSSQFIDPNYMWVGLGK